MTLYEALDMIERGETPEQYKKRLARLRRLANERDWLILEIDVLSDDPRADKKRKRLDKVQAELHALIARPDRKERS